MSAALSARPYTQSPSFVPRNPTSRPASPMPSLPPPHPSLPSNPALQASSSSAPPSGSPSSSSFVPRKGNVPSPLASSSSPSTGMMRSQSTNSPRSATTPHFASRPSSPVPTFTPRLSGEGRIGSSLKNEVRSIASLPKIPKRTKPVEEVEEGEVRELTKEEKEAKRKAARALRKMLEDLPEPLPERLPSKWLPTPAPTPSPPHTGTFKSYAISQASPASSSSSGVSKKRALSDDSPIGLGLGLSMEGGKRSKTSTSPHRSLSKPLSPDLPRTLSASAVPLRAVTPSTSYSPRIRAGPISPTSPRETKDHWTKERWAAAHQTYTNRGTLLKRHGDAHMRGHKAHADYLYLPEDHIRGLLCLTDAVLLYLYGNFCNEQSSGRVHNSPFQSSQQLRDLVRKQWERVVRGEYGNSPASEDEVEARKEVATAMVGLMHMIEAVIHYHLSIDRLSYLQKRGKELAGPSPPSTNGATGTTPPTGPSPSSQSHSSSAETSIPPDVLATIGSTASSSHAATNHLLTSRHHLSMRLLRKRFPKTYDFAIFSPLADEALPAPGDNLGAARYVEIDKPHDFVWPIELGMCAPLAHTSAFGRCLVQESAEALGMDWKLVLE